MTQGFNMKLHSKDGVFSHLGMSGVDILGISRTLYYVMNRNSLNNPS